MPNTSIPNWHFVLNHMNIIMVITKTTRDLSSIFLLLSLRQPSLHYLRGPWCENKGPTWCLNIFKYIWSTFLPKLINKHLQWVAKTQFLFSRKIQNQSYEHKIHKRAISLIDNGTGSVHSKGWNMMNDEQYGSQSRFCV